MEVVCHDQGRWWCVDLTHAGALQEFNGVVVSIRSVCVWSDMCVLVRSSVKFGSAMWWHGCDVAVNSSVVQCGMILWHLTSLLMFGHADGDVCLVHAWYFINVLCNKIRSSSVVNMMDLHGFDWNCTCIKLPWSWQSHVSGMGSITGWASWTFAAELCAAEQNDGVCEHAAVAAA